MPQITGHLETLYFTSLKTDFGWIRPISNGQSLIRLDWNQTGWDESDHPDNVSRETKSQLEAFFAGRLRQFNLPLAPAGKSARVSGHYGNFFSSFARKFPFIKIYEDKAVLESFAVKESIWSPTSCIFESSPLVSVGLEAT